jgi:D-3-phosphoglycerate dehydrogenase / 2-oxoglutarate reductase
VKHMFNVLVSAPYLQREFEAHRARFAAEGLHPIVPIVRERLEEDELLSLVPDVDGIICGDDRITPRVLDHAVRLKVIVKWGTGIDSIDADYARRKGIPVRNTPNAFTGPVSDSVLAYLLAFSRSIVASDRIMKSGSWDKAPGFTLAERCVGIIGVGNIGQMVARKLRAFGARVIGTDILDISADTRAACGIEMVSLDALLEQADLITVNCSLNRTSYHLLERAQFERMKRHAVVVNTARGPIINEADLVWALEHGVIAGAALDVFEEEPLPVSSPLRRMSNVLLSSHASNASPRCWKAVHENSIAMLCESLAPFRDAGRAREVA